MSTDLKKTLCAIAKQMGANFVLHEKPISYEEVFADTGLLPGMAKRADQLCSLCLGYGIGASFIDAEKSLLGSKVQFDDVTPNILRLFCIVDILSELVKNAPTKERVALDEFLYD